MNVSHLRALPSIPYEAAEWVYGHIVNLDCHVAYKTNRYSAPYKYVGKKVELRVTNSLVKIYYNSERLHSHKTFPDYVKYNWATCEEHMPDKFHQANWDDERIKKWAYSIGVYTGVVIDRIFASVRIKEQGYNSALSVLRLSKAYSPERLEISCGIALEKIKSPRYKTLKAILSSNQDQVFLSKQKETKSKELNETAQGYVRGSQYYGGGANK